MLKTIAVVVVLLIAALLVFAATRPDSFRVKRATSIKAPPERIFPLINDSSAGARGRRMRRRPPT
jgi:hypothetical protein